MQLDVNANHHGNAKTSVKQMVEEWHNQSPERKWDEVVEALICHENVKAATQVAETRGVDWKPLVT